MSEVDLAVLKIDDPSVKPLKLADSDTVQAGDFVLAIGNPFGFEETVTDGIISSKGRPNRTRFLWRFDADQCGDQSGKQWWASDQSPRRSDRDQHGDRLDHGRFAGNRFRHSIKHRPHGFGKSC